MDSTYQMRSIAISKESYRPLNGIYALKLCAYLLMVLAKSYLELVLST